MLWPLSFVLVANTNGRLAIPALAGLLVATGLALCGPPQREHESMMPLLSFFSANCLMR